MPLSLLAFRRLRSFSPSRITDAKLGMLFFLRSITTTTTNAADMQQPRFSPGADEVSLQPQLKPLLSANGGRWTLASEGQALERGFKFKTFAKTWDFMTAVSLQCKVKNHHPEWSNVYNTTFIRWTTHNPKGLSEKDVSLASLCDLLAKDFGEVDPEPADDEMRNLANQATAASGDCCGPKK